MPSGSWIHISVKPQGSVAGSRTMGTPAAASRACSAWISRTWIQIITDCPGVATAIQVAGPQQDPAAQNVHTAISAARGVTRQGQ